MKRKKKLKEPFNGLRGSDIYISICKSNFAFLLYV